MQYKTNIDLSQNQLLNVLAQNLAGAPANPGQGQFYFDTTEGVKRMFYFNCTAWKGMDAADASSYQHPTGDGNLHVPATGTTNSGKVLTAGASPGAMAWATPAVTWANISGKPNSTVAQIDGLVTDSHNHSNKSLLDTYTQTNADIADAVTKRHSQNTDAGTSSTTFYVGSSGPKLKNVSSAIHIRNNGDSADANLQAANITASGTFTVNGAATIGSGSQTHLIKSLKTGIKTSGKKSDSDAATRNVFEIEDSSTTPNKLFEVRQNGDTVVGGVLTVSGTGTSTFAGDVTIGGNLHVAGDAQASVDLQGTDLVLTGDLQVHGNTNLGDNAATDKTVIRGLTRVISPKTKALGSSSVNVFKVEDSAAASLFEVRENGDTIIGGILTVNGTGTSSFAGDVTIGGNLHVAGDSTANVDLSGTDLTLTGNLDVRGNTTLGDNAANDTTLINGITTIKSSKTKALGSNSVGIFKIVDSAAASLFEVKENGDTVIGGVLTVNGTGSSTFVGDVSIGGNLTVAKDATVTLGLSGNNASISGNLEVKGNTILGDATTDTIVINGTTTLPTTTTIGTVAYSDLTNAKSKAHSQNTDTGTSSATFQIGSSGVKIKNSSGTELQVRNAGDTAYADLRVNNLVVEGTTTTINSNTVNIGDNEIELNSDVTTSSQNSDGGIAIKRLMADGTTRKDAKIYYSESNGRWMTTQGAVTGTLVTATVTNKFVGTVGNGSATSYILTHNLNTRDANVIIRETNSPYAQVIADVEFTSLTTITVKFAVAPTTNQYTVTIVG